MPTTYVGDKTPTFKSHLIKNGKFVLTSSSATCTTCAVTNTKGENGAGNSV